ncbi:MAG: mechanosensitive ion channel family protein [Burkholderiaceae bacterium]
MKELLARLDLDALDKPWLAQAAAIVAVTIALQLLAEFLLRQAARLTRRTSAVWDDAALHCARGPVRLAIWVVGLASAAIVVERHLSLPALEFVGPTRDIGLMVALTWFMLRFISAVRIGIVGTRREHGQPVDETMVDAIGKLASLVVLLLAVLAAMNTLGYSITSLLTLGGIGGIAIGFAAKDILANFFGGLTIYLDRPFKVGDWIRSPDKDIEGTVEQISWRHTRVRRFNMNPIYVPNSVFTTIVVENPSRMSNRRIKETIGLRYDDFDRIEPIVDEIRSYLAAHEEIDTTRTLIVNFAAYGASSLDIMIYTFTKTRQWVRYHEIKQEVLLRIGRIIESHGAEIAFPTQTLHVDDWHRPQGDDMTRALGQPSASAGLSQPPGR